MATPLFVFAPGAGAPSTSAWMQRYAAHFAALGNVVSLDYPYVLAGRKRPDPLPQLIAAHTEALARARSGYTGPVVLVGKSMGGRIGCHVAHSEPVAAVVCLGYPLLSPGPRKTRRDQVLLGLPSPSLFVQGTRDPLCPLDQLEAVRQRMPAPSTLHIVDQGDHSLEVTKRSLRERMLTQADIEAQIVERVADFLGDLLGSRLPKRGSL